MKILQDAKSWKFASGVFSFHITFLKRKIISNNIIVSSKRLIYDICFWRKLHLYLVAPLNNVFQSIFMAVFNTPLHTSSWMLNSQAWRSYLVSIIGKMIMQEIVCLAKDIKCWALKLVCILSWNIASYVFKKFSILYICDCK